jgi:hypothetical protein
MTGRPKLLPKLLYKVYACKQSWLRNIMLRMIEGIERGQTVSPTLRRIFLDYHRVEVGLYSYGACFNLDRIA